MSYFIYILRCSDNSVFAGTSEDVAERVKAHNKGMGASYTRKRRPVRLVYSEGYNRKNAAIRREKQIKKWTRAKKEALIDGDTERLKRLSKSRQN